MKMGSKLCHFLGKKETNYHLEALWKPFGEKSSILRVDWTHNSHGVGRFVLNILEVLWNYSGKWSLKVPGQSSSLSDIK